MATTTTHARPTLLTRFATVWAEAHTDALTGVGNRKALEDDNPTGGILVFADLNQFKAVNDTHGHATGDQVLIDFTAALKAITPQGRVYRLGGDEFVVTGPTPDQVDQIRAWRHDLGCTTSVGMALITEGLNPAMALADRAMYADKQARSRRRFFLFRVGERRHPARAARSAVIV